MSIQEIEKEIDIIKNMIRILNECLVIYQSEKLKDEFRTCAKDIEMCTKELERLLSIRDQKLNAAAKAQ